MALGLLIALATAIFYASPVGIGLEDRLGLDWLFSIRGPVEPPANVVIVALDKRSSDRLGYRGEPNRWPRSIHGRLIDTLTRAGATAIVFDLFFNRPDENPGEDAALAAAIARSGRVVLLAQREQNRNAGILAYRPPLPAFASAAAAYAPFTVPRETSRVSQVAVYARDSYHLPTLPVAAALVHAAHYVGAWPAIGEEIGAYVLGKAAPAEIGLTRAEMFTDAVHAIRDAVLRDPRAADRLRRVLGARLEAAGDGAAAVDAAALVGAVLDVYSGPWTRFLNAYGPPGAVTTVPYDIVVEGPRPGDPPPPDFAGAVVFVGYSELEVPTNVDDFYTPFEHADGITLSGVEIAATAFANLMTGRSIDPLPLWAGMPLVLLFTAGVTVAAFLLPVRASIPIALAAGLAYRAAAQGLFGLGEIWIPLFAPLVIGLPVGLFAGVTWQYLAERGEKTVLADAMGHLIPQPEVRGILDHGIERLSEHETRYAVCFATDAINSTKLQASQRADEAYAFQNEYFKALSRPVEKYAPHFREFVADGSLFIWCIDGDDGTSRADACLAATEALQAIDAFNREVAPNQLGVRIGLNAGEVEFGYVGDERRRTFRAIGSTINATSRIESLNKRLRTRLLAAESVVAGIDGLALRPLGEFALPGLDTPLPLYEIRGRLADVDARDMTLCLRYAEALDAFQRHAWAEAAQLAERLFADYPDDGPSQFIVTQSWARIEAGIRGIGAAVFRIEGK